MLFACNKLKPKATRALISLLAPKVHSLKFLMSSHQKVLLDLSVSLHSCLTNLQSHLWELDHFTDDDIIGSLLWSMSFWSLHKSTHGEQHGTLLTAGTELLAVFVFWDTLRVVKWTFMAPVWIYVTGLFLILFFSLIYFHHFRQKITIPLHVRGSHLFVFTVYLYFS